MEQTNTPSCIQPSGPCSFAKADPKALKRPEIELPKTVAFNSKPAQKPWSVFEGLYWI